MPDATTYTPTKSNLAHAAAKDFRVALADSVRAGVTAGALTLTEIAAASGMLAGEIERITNATALDLNDAMRVVLVLDAAGVTAFKAGVADAIDAAVA